MSIVRKFNATNGNRPIADLVSLLERGDLLDDPDYQRGHVWGQERQRQLIKSLVMGLPTGSLFINDRSEIGPYVVVDGKQRLRAVQCWLSGELEVPTEWFVEEHDDELTCRYLGDHRDPTVRFDQLTVAGQRLFINSATVAVYTTRMQDDPQTQEAELFALINFGGVPQGESDIT